MERVSLADAEQVARQLGRAPRGAYSIAVRCPYGFPRVLRVPPWVEAEPFPTLYWLTCPFLCRAVGDLEAAGWVGRLERRVATDPELRRALELAHAEYAAERRRLVSAECEEAPRSREWALRLEERGIGGIVDRTHLKCLHLHVAHALAGTNPIGDLVLGMLPRTACDAEEKICSSLG